MTPHLRRSRNIAIDGRKLAAAREAADLTQVQLAAKAGISQSYISGIELGERVRMRPALYARLCRALAVSETGLMAHPPTKETP